MENFEIIQPSPLLAPYVKHYWFLSCDITSQQVPVQRIVPTGMVTLVFHRGRTLSVQDFTQPEAFISGQTSNFADLFQTEYLDMIVVVFRPHGARAFFNMPVSEVKEQAVSLSDLSDLMLTDLDKRIKDSCDNRLCVRLIENFLLHRLRYGEAYNERRITSVIDAVNRGEMSVERLATVSCLSEKQFRRVFSEYIGTNPKDFIRVVRFQRALYMLQNNIEIPLTHLAFECGYYDQPHLIREFREFSGYTPTEYKAACEPIFSDYFSQ